MILLLQHKTPIGDQVWRMCGGASNNKQDSVVVRRADPLPERRSTRVNYRRATIITRPGFLGQLLFAGLRRKLAPIGGVAIPDRRKEVRVRCTDTRFVPPVPWLQGGQWGPSTILDVSM